MTIAHGKDANRLQTGKAGFGKILPPFREGAFLKMASGFSLLELLVVMTLIGILAVLAIPALNSIGSGHAVTREGQVLNDQINLARQLALTRNRETELRLITYAGQGGDNWALQIFDSGAGQPLSRLVKLADNTVISTSPTLSPLLDNLESANASLPSLGTGAVSYRALKFRANGRIKGNFPPRQDYLTLQLRRDNPDTPANYFALQIQPLTGRISIYRP